MTQILLIRHGQTAWNRSDRFRGQADIPLDEVGRAQAEATGRRIKGEWGQQVKAVYASPISRALHTAQTIAAPFGLNAQTHPGLTDMDFGQWQGLSPDEVRARWPVELDQWYHAPHLLHIPGGETLDQMRGRSGQAVDELVSKHPDETIVVVSHAVINRMILLRILGLGNERFWHIGQDTCAINVIDAADGDFTLVTLNDTCHLRQ